MADGGVWRYAYTTDPSGHITQTDITDPRGDIRRLQFDTAGYVTSQTRALGQPEQQTSTYTLDPTSHLPSSVVDPLGRHTTYTYDAIGNPTSVTLLDGTPDKRSYTLTYDPQFSQVTGITDPLGHTTTATYDTRGNLLTVTDPAGATTTLTENTDGQIAAVTDPVGNKTTATYQLGDLTATTTPFGETTSTYVGAGGRPQVDTNATGDSTAYAYDAAWNPTTITNAIGGITTVGYDPNSNPTSLTDPRQNSTSWTYDPLDRPLTETDPLGRVERYTHDTNGNLTSTTDRNGQRTDYSYDALDRATITGYGGTGSPVSYSSTITNTYDPRDRLLKVLDTANGTITRTYDGLDNLTSETTGNGTITYTYDANSRRASMTVPGQDSTSYAYDNADRLTKITQGASTVTTTYDAASRVTARTLPNGVTTTYGYDAESRITAIGYQNATSTLGNLTYGYNPNGNRTSEGGTWARLGMPTPVTNAAYDTANQLTTWGTATLTHDDNGNVRNDGTRSYTWNNRNQLAAVNGDQTQTYSYDPTGRRATRSVGGVTTTYVYDGLNPVQERNGDTVTADNLTGLAVDQYFQRSDQMGTQSLLTDALGSTIALADTNGTSNTSYTYDPFGATTTTGIASANPYQFTGRENDGLSGYYFRARFYAAGTGRFTSPDPIRPISEYLYANDDPGSFSDPTGLSAVAPFSLALIEIGAGEGVGFGAAAGTAIVAAAPWIIAGAGLILAGYLLSRLFVPEITTCPYVQAGKFNPDQGALIDLADEARRKKGGVTGGQAEIIKDWGNEYGVPVRGPESHPDREYGQYPHIHVGPKSHIPVK